MKTQEEFQSFYDIKILPVLNELEKERKKRIWDIYIGRIIRIVCFIISIAVVHYLGWSGIWGIGGGLFIGYVAGSFSYNSAERRKAWIHDRFKSKVIAKIVTFIDKNLKYSDRGSIAEEEFAESKLFLKRIDNYFGEDMVTGSLGKTTVRFCEIFVFSNVQKGVNTENDYSIFRDIATKNFRGIFFIADFNKCFKGKTFVLPENASKATGYELVKLEDPEFQKLFKVYSTNQVESRYILSPSLMQKIIGLKKKFNETLRFSFVNSKVFIAISSKDDLFEPPMNSSICDNRLIKSYFNCLNFMVGIVEELDLNTRIWTKE